MRIAAAVAILTLATAAAWYATGGIAPRPVRDRATLPAPQVSAVPRVADAPPSETRSPQARAEESHPESASGAVAILDAAMRARAVLTGNVSQPSRIDRHGWRATLRVDGVLLGDARLGETITIAWEELATARDVRFADGDRVLVVLDALPTQSLWRARFADEARDVFVVAARGDAFLRAPDGATVAGLEHYLALAPDARAGAPGARELAVLVRSAHSSVAQEALGLLEAHPERVELLGTDGAASLLDAARDPRREPSLRAAALRLASEHRLPGALEVARELTAPGSEIRAEAYRALAADADARAGIDVDALLADETSALRVVGVELAAREPARRARVASLARTDPAPSVRLAAGRALLARDGAAAIKDVIALLDDRDAPVRTGIAEALGALGTAAVDSLQAVTEHGSEPAALVAVLGLSRAGPQGAAALQAINTSHANPRVRAFAGIALGTALPHDD